MQQDVCWLGASVLCPLTCMETEITSHISHLRSFQSIKRIFNIYIYIYKLEICKKCVTHTNTASYYQDMNSQPNGTLCRPAAMQYAAAYTWEMQRARTKVDTQMYKNWEH